MAHWRGRHLPAARSTINDGQGQAPRCGESFPTPQDLKNHQFRAHPAELYLPLCRVPGCDKQPSNITISALNYHFKTQHAGLTKEEKAKLHKEAKSLIPT